MASLDEGLEESLTLHQLGVFTLVGRSLKTTNVIETLHSMSEQRCGRVEHWENSNQKHRWPTTALPNIEPRLRRLVGYRHLSSLRTSIQNELGITSRDRHTRSVA